MVLELGRLGVHGPLNVKYLWAALCPLDMPYIHIHIHIQPTPNLPDGLWGLANHRVFLVSYLLKDKICPVVGQPITEQDSRL